VTLKVSLDCNNSFKL